VPTQLLPSTGFIVTAAGVFTVSVAAADVVFACVQVPFITTLY
jgi:hypothetical protein